MCVSAGELDSCLFGWLVGLGKMRTNGDDDDNDSDGRFVCWFD